MGQFGVIFYLIYREVGQIKITAERRWVKGVEGHPRSICNAYNLLGRSYSLIYITIVMV